MKLDDAAPEGFLVHSFAGDDPIACRDHVREKLGLPKFKPKKSNGKAGGEWKFIREHIYRTADGTPHMRKQKKIDPEGKRQFPQHHWDGKRWIKGVPEDWPKVFYKLPELLKAPASSIVYVTEGEARRRLARRARFCGDDRRRRLRNQGMATPEVIEPLKGRRVVIVVDSDTPGREYGETVARAVDQVADVAEGRRSVSRRPRQEQRSRRIDFLATDRAGVKFIKAVNDAHEWEPAPRPRQRGERRAIRTTS